MDIYQHPSLAGVLVKEGSSIAAELAHALALPDDPVTSLKGPLGVVKRCAWAEPLPLEEVKAICRALDCTVNDVLMASVSGALRAHLIECGEDVDALGIRATVPVNLRPLEHAKKLGNHFGLVFLDLPIGVDNPVERLQRVAASMREIKGSKQALVTFGALAALGMAPAAVQRMALEFLSRKATVVATNVPGPQMPLYLAGSRLSETMFWVPQSGSIGIGVSILSYNGGVHFGLMCDRKRLPDPDSVIARFRPEFEKLLYIVLMGDWQQPIGPEQAAAVLGPRSEAEA
jgi:WS/DGAT/MGAT family acyltransferase